MSSLNNLKKRIKATKSAKKTTKTMELISAVYLKKYQAKLKEIKKFADYQHQIKDDFLKFDPEKSFFTYDKNLPKVIIVFSAFRGLCGNFDFLIRRELKNYIKNLSGLPNEIDTAIVFGKRSIKWIQDINSNNIEEFKINPSKDSDLSPERVLKNIAVMLKRKFMNSEIGQIELLSMQLNGGNYFPSIDQLFLHDIGNDLENEVETAEQNTDLENNIEFEVDYEFIREYLLENYLYVKLYTAYYQSLCAENLARTFAMKQATKSASNMIDEFTLAYNKARQAKITQEVSEIISGMSNRKRKKESINANIILKV
jgi:F-type H+-transporting ATPase subunit gamma